MITFIEVYIFIPVLKVKICELLLKCDGLAKGVTCFCNLMYVVCLFVCLFSSQDKGPASTGCFTSGKSTSMERLYFLELTNLSHCHVWVNCVLVLFFV